MAKPDLGAKRQCQECGTKFFDLNRQKIVCPKCGAVYRVESIPARASARAAVADDDEKDSDDQGAELVSLQDAEATEEAGGATDDVEVEDDESADDTFLEEEEDDDDNVSDLIDGDIESDEEA